MGRKLPAKRNRDKPQSSEKLRVTSSKGQDACSHAMMGLDFLEESHVASHECVNHSATLSGKEVLSLPIEIERTRMVFDPLMTLPIDLQSCTEWLLHHCGCI